VWHFFQWRRVGWLTPGVQAMIIVVLYLATVAWCYGEYRTKGTFFGYPPSVSILFVPIYEEMIFRGFLTEYLHHRMSSTSTIVLVSLLFGLWHLKNIFFLPLSKVLYQIAYVTLIFSPVVTYMTLKLRTIWPAVIVHYLNNLLAPISWILFHYLF